MVPEENSNSASSNLVTVIVPTLNEVENIDALLKAILAQATSNLTLDVLIADGGSVDGTVDRIRAWEAKAPVRLTAGRAWTGRRCAHCSAANNVSRHRRHGRGFQSSANINRPARCADR